MRVSRQVRRTAFLFVVLVIIVSAGPPANARDAVESGMPQRSTPCDTFRTAVNAAINSCKELNQNWVCYGALQTVAQPSGLRFTRPKDRLPIGNFSSLTTSPKPAGAAVMNLRLADEAAPVTAILFGDSTLTGAGRGAFYLRVKDGKTVCEATPSGLAVQTDPGTRAQIRVNDVDIMIGSTAFITARTDRETVVANLGGTVIVTPVDSGVSRTLKTGQQVRVLDSGPGPDTVSAVETSPYAGSTLLKFVAGPNGLPRVYDPDLEPGPLPPCSGEISFGEIEKSGNFGPGQECLFTFCANAGDVVTVRMNAVSGQLDPYVDLRAPDSSLIIWNDNASPADRNSLICNQPLPVTSCGYTIVARPRNNESLGRFSLTLSKGSDCARPQFQCDGAGVQLRSGPGADAMVIKSLPQSTKFHPLQWSADGQWVQVEVLGTGETGWVAAGSLYCDTRPEPSPTATPTPATQPPPDTPTPVPTKLSPFGEP